MTKDQLREFVWATLKSGKVRPWGVVHRGGRSWGRVCAIAFKSGKVRGAVPGSPAARGAGAAAQRGGAAGSRAAPGGAAEPARLVKPRPPPPAASLRP